MEIEVTDYLTWQQAQQANNCPPPIHNGKYFPEWWKNLRGDLRHYLPQSGDHRNHTARMCFGLRGISQLGYTMPLTSDLANSFPASATRHWRYSQLQQEMLHGSCWAEKNQDQYVWGQPIILSWPWRAKMAQNWRLLITAYHLDWSPHWHNFSGYVEANQPTSMWGYDEPLDPDYNYYNLETVLILRNGHTVIPANTAICSFIPVYEPGYEPKPIGGYPF